MTRTFPNLQSEEGGKPESKQGEAEWRRIKNERVKGCGKQRTFILPSADTGCLGCYVL
jgi:hypothetical protein